MGVRQGGAVGPTRGGDEARASPPGGATWGWPVCRRRVAATRYRLAVSRCSRRDARLVPSREALTRPDAVGLPGYAPVAATGIDRYRTCGLRERLVIFVLVATGADGTRRRHDNGRACAQTSCCAATAARTEFCADARTEFRAGNHDIAAAAAACRRPRRRDTRRRRAILLGAHVHQELPERKRHRGPMR